MLYHALTPVPPVDSMVAEKRTEPAVARSAPCAGTHRHAHDSIGDDVNHDSPHPWPPFRGVPLLGTNGTESMLALLDQGGADYVDYFKVGPFMGRRRIAELARDYPLMLHLDDALSAPDPPSTEMLERLSSWVALTGTPWASEHIGFSAAEVTLDAALITQPASPLLSRQEALDNIVRSARALAEGLAVPLLLENLPLFPNLAHLHVGEPDFVAEVIARSDCDLLLDLAHARVSADLLGQEIHAYLEQLPLGRVVELHLSGPRRLGQLDAARRRIVRDNAPSVADRVPCGDDNLADAHETLQAEDYALFEWVLARTQPLAVSLEYFRQPGPLREQLLRLGEILGRCTTRKLDPRTDAPVWEN